MDVGEACGHYYTIRFTEEGVEVFNDMNGEVEMEMPYTNGVLFADFDFFSLKSWRIFSYKKLTDKRKR